jgi:hypothetical protein
MDRWALFIAANAVLLCSCGADALSPAFVERRRLLTAVAAAAGLAPMWWTAVVDLPAARAACMAGDLSPECIGVYKLPENAPVSVEDLKRLAPDIKYVGPLNVPKSTSDAVEILLTQRIAADDIMAVVQAGRLEEAGIKTLNTIPRIVLAGRRILDDTKNGMAVMEKNGDVRALREQQLEENFQILEAAWKSADVAIGQGLRGDLGVSAVAQIRILSDLRDAVAALDDFLAVTKTKRSAQ